MRVSNIRTLTCVVHRWSHVVCNCDNKDFLTKWLKWEMLRACLPTQIYSGLCWFKGISIKDCFQPPPSDPACWAALPLPLQSRLRQTVASLHSLLASLGAKEEIWSVGNLARYFFWILWCYDNLNRKQMFCPTLSILPMLWHVFRCLGDQLEAWTPARTRRKTALNKVELLILSEDLKQ